MAAPLKLPTFNLRKFYEEYCVDPPAGLAFEENCQAAAAAPRGAGYFPGGKYFFQNHGRVFC